MKRIILFLALAFVFKWTLVAPRQSAYYVDKLLKGAEPRDVPVEQPRESDFTINLKTAKQIGLTIPPNVLA